MEALNYDTDMLCPLQWGLLWFSAPTNLNHKFVNDRTKVAKFRETVNCAIELTCNIAFDGAHTPKGVFFTGGDCVFLCYAHDKDWNLEEEMQGWGAGKDRLATLTAVRDCAGRALNDA